MLSGSVDRRDRGVRPKTLPGTGLPCLKSVGAQDPVRQENGPHGVTDRNRTVRVKSPVKEV